MVWMDARMIKERAQMSLDHAVRQLMAERSIENYGQAFVILKSTRPGLIEGYDFICRRQGRRDRGLAETQVSEELHQQILARASQESLSYLEAYEALVYGR